MGINISVGSVLRTLGKGVLGIATLAAVASGVLFLNSGTKMNNAEGVKETRELAADISTQINNQRSNVLEGIYDIPKVYTIPWSETPVTKPKAEGYTYKKGIPVQYEDETISVTYWTERFKDSNVHLAKIVIQHPTQLRTAIAGGTYGKEARYTPKQIAQQVNAVIATNADYYNYRTGGVLKRQNVLYRNKPQGWDLLMIDKNGDFHIYYDKDEEVQRMLEEGDIVNTLHFGPSLVIDGKVNLMHTVSGCGTLWGGKMSPRTAIGQVDKLTYLMCCVEGRMSNSLGISTKQLAELMLSKGCTQAYCLDGGQSTAMIFDGKLLNRPLWGGMRTVSDVVYFASALTE